MDNKNMGWECPKCGRVYSPTTEMCLHCPKSVTTHTSTDTLATYGTYGRVKWYETHDFTPRSIKNDNPYNCAIYSLPTVCEICGKTADMHIKKS